MTLTFFDPTEPGFL